MSVQSPGSLLAFFDDLLVGRSIRSAECVIKVLTNPPRNALHHRFETGTREKHDSQGPDLS